MVFPEKSTGLDCFIRCPNDTKRASAMLADALFCAISDRYIV